MVATDKAFTGSIPDLYDRLLVPLLFDCYAQDLAGRLAALAPQDVLEIAAGTGALTRVIAAALPSSARITASDLNGPMLETAAARQREDPRITWREADALALPFGDASFDAVVCQFGAMFFPDKTAAWREVRRVLRPGGRLLFNVWDAIEKNDFAEVVTAALAEIFPKEPPRFLARTPHGYHDVEKIRQDVADAGFATVTMEWLEQQSIAARPQDAAAAYCEGTPLRNEIEARGSPPLAQATQHASEALARRFGAGRIEGRISAWVVTASG
jgi:ubiquinone/menaquinone biosynthesis C-methylase UbiE